jgi:hypothetical protein
MSGDTASGLQRSRSMPRSRIDYFVGDDPPGATRSLSVGAGVAPIAPISGVRSVQAARGVRAASSSGVSPVAGNLAGQPDCRRCQHFAVSWDPAVPYLCRGFGFKSRVLPAHEVLQADGHPCRLFAARS